MYFAQTRSQLLPVKGELPLTADEALSFVDQARRVGLEVDLTDHEDRPVTIEQLREAID